MGSGEERAQEGTASFLVIQVLVGSHKDKVIRATSQQFRAPLASSSLPLLNPKAIANIISITQSQRSGHRVPTQCTTSFQGQKEVAIALQLLHELLVLQEEGDPLVLQVLLPAALQVPGARPGHRGQAAISTPGLGAPRVALRRGASMLNAYPQGHMYKHPCTSGGTRVLSQNPPATTWGPEPPLRVYHWPKSN